MEKSKDIQTKFDEVRFYTDNPTTTRTATAPSKSGSRKDNK